MRKRTLFYVPLYCILAGIISYYVFIYLGGRFFTVEQADGVFAADETRVWITRIVIFVVAFLIGGLVFFRKMTRKELIVSASIMTGIYLLVVLTAWILVMARNEVSTFFAYVSLNMVWAEIVSQAIFSITQNVWLGMIVGSFTPCLFLLFGKRSGKTYTT